MLHDDTSNILNMETLRAVKRSTLADTEKMGMASVSLFRGRTPQSEGHVESLRDIFLPSIPDDLDVSSLQFGL